MKNFILSSFCTNTKTKAMLCFFLVFFTFTFNNANAQCNAANFTLGTTAGNCKSNNTVTVTIPGASTCSTVQATLYQGSTVVQGPYTLPANGVYTFNNVGVGTYNVVLTQGATTYPAKTINVTSNYVDLTFSSAVTAPSCNPATENYTPDATLTVTVPSNVGLPPFTFTLVSPTAGTVT